MNLETAIVCIVGFYCMTVLGLVAIRFLVLRNKPKTAPQCFNKNTVIYGDTIRCDYCGQTWETNTVEPRCLNGWR